MATMSSKPIVAIFGATGGTALAVLIRCMNNGFHVNALARTPTKLTDLLLKRDIPQATLDSNLRIIAGDVKDKTAISQTLTTTNGKLVDVILSGIGTYPSFQISLRQPFVIAEPTLCTDAMSMIVDALGDIQKRNPTRKQARPFIAAISTTGLSTKQRDVPLAFTALYHWLLSSPHVDKKGMEAVLERGCANADESSPASGFAVVRASLLTDGAAKDVRMGWEWAGEGEGAGIEKAPGPAVGYFVSRQSVGRWVFDEIVAGQGRGQWAGKMVTVTE